MANIAKSNKIWQEPHHIRHSQTNTWRPADVCTLCKCARCTAVYCIFSLLYLSLLATPGEHHAMVRCYTCIIVYDPPHSLRLLFSQTPVSQYSPRITTVTTWSMQLGAIQSILSLGSLLAGQILELTWNSCGSVGLGTWLPLGRLLALSGRAKKSPQRTKMNILLSSHSSHTWVPIEFFFVKRLLITLIWRRKNGFKVWRSTIDEEADESVVCIGRNVCLLPLLAAGNCPSVSLAHLLTALCYLDNNQTTGREPDNRQTTDTNTNNRQKERQQTCQLSICLCYQENNQTTGTVCHAETKTTDSYNRCHGLQEGSITCWWNWLSTFFNVEPLQILACCWTNQWLLRPRLAQRLSGAPKRVFPGQNRPFCRSQECRRGLLRGPSTWYGSVPTRHTVWKCFGCYFCLLAVFSPDKTSGALVIKT